MQRLDELHSLDIQSADLLALGLKTLLCNELLGIDILRITVHILSTERDLELRMQIVAELHKI